MKSDDGLMKKSRINWTPEQETLLRDRYPHEHTASLAESLGYSVQQVYTKAGSLGLRKTAEFLASALACRLRRGDNVGAAHRFKPGHKTWNRGIKFDSGGRSHETRFKPGQKPHTWNPVGHERMSKEGYLERKIADTGVTKRDYVQVHRLVWMARHGDIPAGHIISFKDGNKRNFDIGNLECISRRELMARNTVHNYGKEIAQLVQLRGAVTRQINKRERKTR